MSWPPMLVHIKIKNKNHQFGFWVPLFLIFLFTLPFIIALLPLILLGVIILWPTGWGKWILMSLKVACVALWSMRGLKVDVQNRNETVFISIV